MKRGASWDTIRSSSGYILNVCHVMLYSVCHVILYNMCHVRLYNICYVMLLLISPLTHALWYTYIIHPLFKRRIYSDDI